MLHVRDTLAMAQEDDANKNTKTKQQIKELQIQLKVIVAGVFIVSQVFLFLLFKSATELTLSGQ